ncbi:MAG: hypothetical protein ACE37H_03630 [Phycisphaeraceae bacterium]
MPISLSIGLSRKVSKDYNSRGYSVNLDVELPADAINDQQSIANSADRLFALCDQLLECQISGQGVVAEQTRSSNTNGHRRSGGVRTTLNHVNGRPLTNAQERAINSMARKLGNDADHYAEHEFGSVLADLDVRQASQLIDILKTELPTQAQGAR